MENCLQISAPVPPKPPPTPPKEGRNKWGNDLKTKSAKGQSGLLCKSLSVWHSPPLEGPGEIISLEGKGEELFVSVLS